MVIMGTIDREFVGMVFDLDGRTDGWADGQTDSETDGRTIGRRKGQRVGRAAVRTDGWRGLMPLGVARLDSAWY